jgi:calcineurin-like phosphoesterase family protein
MREVWFTSDQHFGHPQIIGHCHRPFATVEEMDEKLIESWNSRIKHGDVVYHLGDITFRSAKNPGIYFGRLHGLIHLIAGNHDDETVKKRATCFAWIKDYFYLRLDRKKVVLSHYPFESWRASRHGGFHLHGHSHGGARRLPRRLDVGVDSNEYNPWSWGEIKEKLDQEDWEWHACPACGNPDLLDGSPE